jgi:hypothetical protein
LRDAATEGGCPICTLALRSVARYLDATLYENVNDPRTRDAVVAARGYCNEHSWQLRELPAALGTALMYRDIVRRVAESLAERAPRARPSIFAPPGAGMLDRLAALTGGAERGSRDDTADPHVACPACTVRARYEKVYLGALLDHVADEEMVEALRSGGGLCLVHLDLAIATSRDAGALERLLAVQRDCMLALHDELSEFVRKNDYRFSGEGMGAERDSWIRAIEMVAGKKGIR